METTVIETAKPEVGNVADLALFDVNLAQVKQAMTLISAAPAITDKASRTALYEVLTSGAKMEKAIDAARLSATLKLRNRVEAMNNYCKDVLAAPLMALIAKRKKEIQAFDAEEEKKRLAELARIRAAEEESRRKQAEEERLRREAAEAEQRRIAEEARVAAEAEAAKLKGIAKAKALAKAEEDAKAALAEAARKAAEAESTAKIDASLERADLKNQAEDLEAAKAKGAGKRWTWEIEDITKVPHEYLEVVRGRVTDAVRGGAREIPGIRVFQEESLALR